MSQQTLFAICLFAGVVAMASAQTFDWQSCSKSARYEADKFRDSLVEAGKRFTESMQQTAGQAADTSAFQKDLDKLADSLTSMTDMSQSFSVERFTQMYLENIQTVASLSRSAFRVSLVSNAMDSYIEFGNSVMSSNTRFMQAITRACMPSRRVQPTNV